jgi:hypothetical protein
VVLVITDVEGAPPPSDEFELQALQTAAQTTAAAAAAKAGRTPLSGTGPTLTSGQVKPTPASTRRAAQKCSPSYYDSL